MGKGWRVALATLAGAAVGVAAVSVARGRRRQGLDGWTCEVTFEEDYCSGALVEQIVREIRRDEPRRSARINGRAW